jgi:hypothetical protein
MQLSQWQQCRLWLAKPQVDDTALAATSEGLLVDCCVARSAADQLFGWRDVQ